MSEHVAISPAILYFGTPVSLITSTNPDLTSNICPISSVFWLGHRCILGFAAESATPHNILRTGDAVVNLPHDGMATAVNALATTTGSERPSAGKLARGYRHVKDKWSAAGLTPMAAEIVRPHRVKECQVQMECVLKGEFPVMRDLPDRAGLVVVLEMHVARVHVLEELRLEGSRDRVDPDRWRPMVMSFQQLYGLRQGRLAASALAQVDEEMYRPMTRSDVVQQPGDRGKDEAVRGRE